VSGRPSHALEDVAITRRNLYPESHPEATSRENYNPQFQADVYNLSSTDRRTTVTWYLGETAIGAKSESVPAGETETIAKRISWESLTREIEPGEYELTAKLSPQMELAWGAVTVHGRQGTPDDRNDDGGPSDGPLSNLPKLPAVGPLTRRQTTLAAGLLAAVLLTVIV